MPKYFAGLLILMLAGRALGAGAAVSISLQHDSDTEQRTRRQLQQLLARYDLAPWLFTRSIIIDDAAIPHSHPQLTLHTRHLKDDDLLLSTFVHEQAHWFLAQHRDETQKAEVELREKYPSIPLGFPEGSNDAEENYQHLMVILLEYRADREFLGELRAWQVMSFWAQDHYTWLYRTVLNDRAGLDEIVRRHHLIPEAGAGR